MHSPEIRHRKRRMWQPGPAWVMAAAAALVVLPVAIALYAVQGFSGAALLLAVGGASILLLIAIGHRVGKLRQSLDARDYDVVDALIVRGILQSPGIAGLGREELVLIPVVGSRISIPYHEIRGCEETLWFNGALLIGKTGFWLTLPSSERTGIALPDSRANALRVKLNQP